MIRIFFITIMCLTITFAKSQSIDGENIQEEYLMLVVATSYSGLGAGSSILIYEPGATDPNIIKPTKKDDFQALVLKELNNLGKLGWSLKSTYQTSYHLSGSSGTSRTEIVHLFWRKKAAD